MKLLFDGVSAAGVLTCRTSVSRRLDAVRFDTLLPGTVTFDMSCLTTTIARLCHWLTPAANATSAADAASSADASVCTSVRYRFSGV